MKKHLNMSSQYGCLFVYGEMSEEPFILIYSRVVIAT